MIRPGFGFMATLTPVLVADGQPDPCATFEPVGQLTAAGITDFRVRLPVPAELSRACDFLGAVMDRFRLLTGRNRDSDSQAAR